MSKFIDLALRVIGFSSDSVSCFDLLTKRPVLLSVEPIARMSPADLLRAVHKAGVGGIILADQCLLRDGIVRAHYVTAIKTQGQGITAYAAPATRLDLLRVDDGIHTKITDSFSLFQSCCTASTRISAIITVAKPAQVTVAASVREVEDVMSALFNSVKGHSYTPKAILYAGDSYSGEIIAKRREDMLLDWDKTVTAMRENEMLERVLSEGFKDGVRVIPAVALRMSSLSTKSLISKLTEIRPGKTKNARVDKFFRESYSPSMEPLYAPGLVVSQKSVGCDWVDFGSRYQQLGNGTIITRQAEVAI